MGQKASITWLNLLKIYIYIYIYVAYPNFDNPSFLFSSGRGEHCGSWT